MSKDTTLYTIKNAIINIKKAKNEKFDSTVELHINLDIDVSKTSIRFPVSLPHGTGKSVKVAVMASKKIDGADLQLTEEDLTKIEKGKIKPKVDFEILVVEPQYMPIVAKIAQILGPLGLMPNPKSGSVTENVKSAVEAIKKGQVEIKMEKEAPLIHTIIGKRSFDSAMLEENLMEILKSLKQKKPVKAKPEWIKDIYINTTMGKSVRINPEII